MAAAERPVAEVFVLTGRRIKTLIERTYLTGALPGEFAVGAGEPYFVELNDRLVVDQAVVLI